MSELKLQGELQLDAEQMDTMRDWTIPADLVPELKQALRSDGGDGLTMLAHPLVHTFYFPAVNSLYNAQLEQKKKSLAAAVESEEWHTYVFLHERPYRLDALLHLLGSAGKHMSPQSLGQLAASIWTDSENFRENRARWMLLFNRPAIEPRYFMDGADWENFLAFPDALTVYRGGSLTEGDTVEFGLSWTTNIETARWFANRWGAGGGVHRRRVEKHEILFINSDRNENEVVLDPKYLV